ncbi:hypothetical protein GCM10023333_30240 [Ferrimonas pelagia]|uniref:Uncharacterized protein n=1 Tax=Ferrimonas pelagia TaxID=1177826 RepID=A0ABP9F5S7_9GAMM
MVHRRLWAADRDNDAEWMSSSAAALNATNGVACHADGINKYHVFERPYRQKRRRLGGMDAAARFPASPCKGA